MYAVGNGHTACARLLIDAGAELDCKNNVRSAFDSPSSVAGALSLLVCMRFPRSFVSLSES